MTEHDMVLAVNAAYYRAFATSDAAAMEQIWALDGVSCVHPGWRPLVGRAAVVRSYRDIFENSQTVAIVCTDEMAILHGDTARVICMERIGGMRLAATNCFVRTADGWLMTHHQASLVADMNPAVEPPGGKASRTLN